ncbi:MAG: hypothetical protein WD599_01730, partial [Balneolaceae bacterium]
MKYRIFFPPGNRIKNPAAPACRLRLYALLPIRLPGKVVKRLCKITARESLSPGALRVQKMSVVLP